MPTNNASKQVKLGPVDAAAMAPLIFLLLAPSWTLLLICVSFIFLLAALDYYGLRLKTLFRLIRAKIAGDSRALRSIERDRL